MKELNKRFICTYTGKRVYFMDPTADMIDLDDIAHSLSLQCRFNGHCRQMYSVANHSMLVADMVSEEATLYALLHDAAESYICDITRPMKRILNDITDGIIKEIEHKLLHVINEKFGLFDISEEIKKEVKIADNTALWIEAHALFDNRILEDWSYGEMMDPIPARELMKFQSVEECELKFRYTVLGEMREYDLRKK